MSRCSERSSYLTSYIEETVLFGFAKACEPYQRCVEGNSAAMITRSKRKRSKGRISTLTDEDTYQAM